MTPAPVLARGTYVYVVAQALRDHLPALLKGALLFNLACLPAFCLQGVGWFPPALLAALLLAGPAWSALLTYETRLLQGRNPGATDFWQAFRRSWRPGTQLGLLAVLPLIALRATAPALQAGAPVPAIVWLGLGADFLGLAVAGVLSIYAFPGLAQRKQSALACLRDALILASRYPTHSLGLLAMGILFGFGIAYLSWGLLLLLPAVFGLFIAANYLLVLDLEAARRTGAREKTGIRPQR